MSDADVWKAAYEREHEARLQVERQLDEKMREVQSSLSVMKFQHDLMLTKSKEIELLAKIASFVHHSMSVRECVKLFLESLSLLLPCVYAQAFVHDDQADDVWRAFDQPQERIPMPPAAKEILQSYRGELQPYHKESIQSRDIVLKYVEPADTEYLQRLVKGGIVVVACIPLLSSDECVAIVEFGFLTDEIAGSDAVGVIRTASHQIGVAMERREQQVRLAENFRDLMKAHEDLKSMKNQLVQSEKMASLGQLSAGVAHEINNPVGFVLSNMGSLRDYLAVLVDFVRQAKVMSIEAIRTQGELATDNTDYARICSMAMEFEQNWQRNDIDFILGDLEALMKDSEGGLVRVRDIVASLKDFARADNEQKHESTQLADLIEQSVRLVWNEIKYTSELKTDFHSVAPVTCNARQISQVIVNLLVNAAQAMKESGLITVRLREVEGFARIDIEDTGAGIAPEILDHIFDPFFTTKPVGVGTGLGLSIAYGILQSHNGHIDVESNVGKGTCFSIYLPLNHA